MKVGIVIVSWNSAEVLPSTLKSCLNLQDVGIVVVDNASSDGSAELARGYSGVTVIANRNNLGFAGGVNQGIAALPNCPVVLLLNPDAEPVRGIREMAAAAELPGVGAVGGRLVDAEGRTQHGFQVRRFPTPGALAGEVLGLNRVFPMNPWNRHWRMVGFDPDLPCEVEQPAGAFLMVNRSAWETVGGLDESFHPAWFEDVDFCLRLKRKGYSIRYFPTAVARHVGGHSASRLTWRDRQLFWYDNLLRYAARHFSAAARRMVAIAVMAGSVPRALTAFLADRNPRAFSVYIEVIWVAYAAFGGSMNVRRAGSPSSRQQENRAKRS